MHRRIFARLQLLLAAAFLSSATVVTIPVMAQEVETEAPATEAAVEPTVAADANLVDALTTGDPTIPIDQLEFLVQPLTVEELKNEASAWLVLLKNKVDEYSASEVAIKRINLLVDQENEAAAVEQAASQAFLEARIAKANAEQGTPAYEEASQQLEDAREELRQADALVRAVEKAKEKLRISPGFKAVIREAQLRKEVLIAEAVVQKTKEVREQLTPGTPSHATVSQRIRTVNQAITDFNQAREDLSRTATGFAGYDNAVKRFEAARQNLDAQTKAIPGTARLIEETSATAGLDIEVLLPPESLPTLEANQQPAPEGNPPDAPAEQTTQSTSSPAPVTSPAADLKQEAEKLVAEAEAQTRLKKTMVDNLPNQEKERNAIIDRLRVVLTALEAKGGDPEPFTKYIDSATRTKLDVTDTEGLTIRFTNWLFDPEGGLGVIIKLVTFVAITVVAWFASLLIARFSERLLTDVLKASKLFQGFAVNIIKRGVFIAGICLALATVGIDLGPILAVVGGLSFILAFALQSNLGNFASGLMLLINKPFDVGDEVKVGGFWAYVESISLANTKLKGFDGSAISLPNNTVWGGDIINYTHADLRKVSMGIEIKFSQDVDQISQIWTELASAHPKVLADPGPGIFPWNATYNYNIWVALLAWSTTDDYWDVYVDLLKTLQKRLDEANIELAAPVQNINLHDMNGTPAIAGQPPASAIDVQAVAASNGESGA